VAQANVPKNAANINVTAATIITVSVGMTHIPSMREGMVLEVCRFDVSQLRTRMSLNVHFGSKDASGHFFSGVITQ
jgi:hypothetical protein